MKTILVVDDQPVIRELIVVTFADEDCRVVEAASGAEALALARQYVPDLILLDVSLPHGPDGLAICRAIKSDPQTKKCIVYLVSARALPREVKAGYAAGADDYIVKPFSPTELFNKIERALAGRQ